MMPGAELESWKGKKKKKKGYKGYLACWVRTTLFMPFDQDQVFF